MTSYSDFNKKLLFVFFQTIFLLVCSCTPIPQPEVEIDGIKPIWETKLPGKAGIYNYGLIGLPIYDGKIMFHSTYFTGIINDAFEEDNRIHALDMNTGEIMWTYPISYNKNKPMLFGGAAYQLNEFIFIKMQLMGSELTDKIVGLNLKNGQELWYKEIPYSLSYNTNTNVVGNGSEFYYFVQSTKNATLCNGSVVSGETKFALEIQPIQGFNFSNVTSNVLIHENKNLIIAGAWERDTTNRETYAYKNFLYIIDAKNNTLISKVYSDSIDKEMLIAKIYCDGDKVFAACGLTTISYNLSTQSIEWTYKSTESYNYMTNDVVSNSDVVFLYGGNRYVGLDAQTGKKLYQGDIHCSEANAFNGYVYVIGGSKLYILDIKTGKTLHRIICPEEYTTNTGFNPYCIPQVYGDKLYVFGNYHAYCYEAVPKEE